ncbi:hypothetical protein H8959_016204 [Pygathrix nigripes]
MPDEKSRANLKGGGERRKVARIDGKGRGLTDTDDESRKLSEGDKEEGELAEERGGSRPPDPRPRPRSGALVRTERATEEPGPARTALAAATCGCLGPTPFPQRPSQPGGRPTLRELRGLDGAARRGGAGPARRTRSSPSLSSEDCFLLWRRIQNTELAMPAVFRAQVGGTEHIGVVRSAPPSVCRTFASFREQLSTPPPPARDNLPSTLRLSV